MKWISFVGVFFGGIVFGWGICILHLDGNNSVLMKNNDEHNSVIYELKKSEILSKVKLFQAYINFTFLNVCDDEIERSVRTMNELVESLNNNELRTRYYAAGEGSIEEREKKVLEFFNFFTEDIYRQISETKCELN